MRANKKQYNSLGLENNRQIKASMTSNMMTEGLKICKKFNNYNKNNAHNTARYQGSKMLHKTVLLQDRRMIHSI